MLLFVGFSLLLIPELGVEGAPLAMIGAFIPPSLYVFYRSQRGRSPIRMPWRPMFLATLLAVAVALAHSQLDPGGVVLQVLAGLFAIGLWIVLCLLTGAVPQAHRAPLLAMVRGLRPGAAAHGFQPVAGLEALTPQERRALRRAIVRGLPPEEAANPVLDGGGNGDRAERANVALVKLLRRTAAEGGVPGLPGDYARTGNRPRDRARDSQIGAFLFAPGPIAERDQLGKRLINDGVAEAFDLHTLEAVVASLKRVEKPVWKKGS
jgi:hypothetical protein